MQLMDATISWEGDSLSVLREFPEDVRSELGVGLRQLQQGKRPSWIADQCSRSVLVCSS